ncbi:MAG: hypothetical protein E6767_01400 [Dysgonomonas sp.]|nr:hypothetical protein [Dysgonomonas sp.]
MLDKLVPYQGWAGVVFCIWGVWGIISSILSLGMLSYGLWGIIYWVTLLAVSVVSALLGFILGYSLIVKYALSKNEAAREKGEQVLEKIRPMQGKIGLLGIILGAWLIICSFLYAAAVAVTVATA